MNIRKSLACAAALALAASLLAADEKPLKVLAIGNSFSLSCIREMPPIAEALGCKLDFATLYIGGCEIDRHCRNIACETTNALWRPYGLYRVTCGRRTAEGRSAGILETLKADRWDVVTIQQASHRSWDPKSYEPWGDTLLAKVRELAPQAKVYVQETWAYPPWDRRLAGFGLDPVDMYAHLHDTYGAFAAKRGLAVIPTGTAAQFAPDRDTLFTAPDFHFNRDGEYLQGLVWVGTLFDKDVTACSYVPQGLDAVRAAELRASVRDTLAQRAGTRIRRAFRPARLVRGNTNLMGVQPIDTASWIWEKEDGANVLVFRRRFETKKGDGVLILDVSADERFYLTLDGKFVARGPNRGTVENWQYQTFAVELEPGAHELRAVVTRVGDDAPLAQLSHRGGFIVKANGAYDAVLTTGKGAWEVGRFTGMKPNGKDGGAWGTGSQFLVTGSGPFAVEPQDWQKPVVVRGPASTNFKQSNWGIRTKGWMLFPSQIPEQIENAVRPGAFRAAAHGTAWRTNHVYTAAETKAPEVEAFNRLLKGEVKEVVIPAKTRLQLAWHLGRYICAYPEATLAKGLGARFSWTFIESSKSAADDRKHDRREIVGKYLQGFGDTFVTDGRDNAVFSAPWFRCGLWSRIDIETADEPLVVRDLKLLESRSPLEMESDFSSPDDPSFADIRRIAARAMQMCCHEMLFDCPFYEQQMYPGDTRVQLLVLTALSRDDRMIKRAIELFDLAARDDGQCPFNWPTRGTQEGFTYTLCYLCMFGDYAMNHADRAWLRARLPGLRKTMAGCEYYERADGLLDDTPGWNFMDWTTEWGDNTVPGSNHGRSCNSFVNLFWLLAMQSAATTERTLGNDLQAQYWETKAARLKAAIVKAFWDGKRCLIADTAAKKTFSEHCQALAIVTDCLGAVEREKCFAHLIADKDLAHTTVYFNYYLFEAYFKMGRADLFQKRLDLWRGYVAKGITTLSEMPDTPEMEGRSDCHAWGAHPIWFMQTGLAGIRSAAPFFAKVLVAPQPGTLKSIKARHPHPKGFVDVDLTFADGAAHGTVSTPVPGIFRFGGKDIPLKPGVTKL